MADGIRVRETGVLWNIPEVLVLGQKFCRDHSFGGKLV